MNMWTCGHVSITKDMVIINILVVAIKSPSSSPVIAHCPPSHNNRHQVFTFVLTCHCWKLSPQLLRSPLVFQGPPCPAWATNQFWVLEKNLFYGKKVYLHFPLTSAAPWRPWWGWRRTSSRGGTILRMFTIIIIVSFAIRYIFAQILCFFNISFIFLFIKIVNLNTCCVSGRVPWRTETSLSWREKYYQQWVKMLNWGKLQQWENCQNEE